MHETRKRGRMPCLRYESTVFTRSDVRLRSDHATDAPASSGSHARSFAQRRGVVRRGVAPAIRRSRCAISAARGWRPPRARAHARTHGRAHSHEAQHGAVRRRARARRPLRCGGGRAEFQTYSDHAACGVTGFQQAHRAETRGGEGGGIAGARRAAVRRCRDFKHKKRILPFRFAL